MFAMLQSYIELYFLDLENG